ncbi:hypothetical protein LJK87_24675 [Paenibacillus sp. P25]|nr:hypothetical protein LJK87_24675 [Paenibacillus sp. P25]
MGASARLAPYEARLIEAVRLADLDAALSGKSEGNASKPWTWKVDASAPWEMKALQPNAVRFETFRLTLQGLPEVTLPEGAAVQAKTFIDQCADLTDRAALPVQMSQLFGTPMRISMAYPLNARYIAEFTVEQRPERLQLLMDRSAVSGEAVIRINGRELDPGRFESVFLYDHMNIAQDITSFLREGHNELTVDVQIAHDWDGITDALYFTGPFGVRFDENQRPVLTAAGTQRRAASGRPV